MSECRHVSLATMAKTRIGSSLIAHTEQANAESEAAGTMVVQFWLSRHPAHTLPFRASCFTGRKDWVTFTH